MRAELSRSATSGGYCRLHPQIDTKSILRTIDNPMAVDATFVDKIFMLMTENRIPTTTSLPEKVCPACNAVLPIAANFCLNCGKRLRTKPAATSVSKQLIVYLVSFFLAPLGLWYAWRYLREGDQKSKTIGMVAIALTIISIAFAIWTTAELFNSFSQYLRLLKGLEP